MRIERMSILAAGRISAILALALLATLSSNAALEIPALPDYQLGDVVEVDVLAPIALAVPDPEETERLQERVGRSTIPIFRFRPSVADEVEQKLRSDFDQQRERFLAALQKSYGRATLNRATINHSSFARFVAAAQKQQPGFPLSVDLAGQWALGETGGSVCDQFVSHLREAMNRHICAESIDESVRAGFEGMLSLPKAARVVPLDSFETKVELRQVEKRAAEVSITHFRSLAAARAELVNKFRATGDYLATFLQPNCILDIGLTRASREKQMAWVRATRHFKPGEVIVRNGQRVDAVAKAALKLLDDERRAHQRTQARREMLAATGTQVVSWARTLTANAAFVVTHHPWMTSLAVGSLVICLVWLRRSRSALTGDSAPATSYTVILNRDRNETIFLPVTDTESPATTVHSLATKPEAETAEQQLAETERRAEELLAKVRAGLAPELARHMMDRLVQELLAQRASLLETQRVASNHVAVLEQRFTALHRQLSQQIRTEQDRNSQLEQKLVTKDVEHSQLLKAIVSAQKKLKENGDSN